MSLRSEGYKPAMVNGDAAARDADAVEALALAVTLEAQLLGLPALITALLDAINGDLPTAGPLSDLADAFTACGETDVAIQGKLAGFGGSPLEPVLMHDKGEARKLDVVNDDSGCCSKQPKRGWFFAQKAKKGCDCYPFTWTPKMEKAAEAKRKIYSVAGHSGPFGVPLDL